MGKHLSAADSDTARFHLLFSVDANFVSFSIIFCIFRAFELTNTGASCFIFGIKIKNKMQMRVLLSDSINVVLTN